MSERPRILVVGGAGAFGSRLADGIAASLDATVVLGGRDIARAEAAAARLRARHPGAAVEVARVDASTLDASGLRGFRLAALADVAGPFQGAGYGLVRSCIAARVPYVDLADGRAFVAGFPRLDAEARAAGVAVTCGASSTPALSNAALDALVERWHHVDRVEVAISPGNRAPRGLSVFQAILAYAGQPVSVLEQGTWSDRPGWGMTIRKPVAGLGARRLSLCETPDLDIIPARHPSAHTAVFRAGLELGLLHDGLRLATLPVRAGLLPSLRPFAAFFRAVAGLFEPFGTGRGGMSVTAWGVDAFGERVNATWNLLAEEGDGPYVPTLPALALLRRILDGEGLTPGARACAGLLELADIEAEMRRHRIRTWIERDRPSVPAGDPVVIPLFKARSP